jgi:hypothetical protein
VMVTRPPARLAKNEGKLSERTDHIALKVS